MSEQFLRDVEPHLARLARGPGNAGALAGLRTAFAQARTETGHGPVAELARCAENLLSAQLEGYVSPTDETAELAAEAARGLFALDGSARADLAERMDAAASGINTALLGGLPAPSSTSKPEPPLLTEREDGVFVKAGMFAEGVANDRPAPVSTPAPAAESDTPPVASTTVAPQPIDDVYTEPSAGAARTKEPAAAPDSEPLRHLARDIDADIEQLDRHINALVTIASGTDETSTAVQHASGELAATAAALKRHNRLLRQWAEQHSAGGGEQPKLSNEKNDQEAALERGGQPASPGGDVQRHSVNEREWIKLQGGRE